MSSEFKIDPARACRANGHKWHRPHPKSSFWKNPRNRDKRQCSRCEKWIDEVMI